MSTRPAQLGSLSAVWEKDGEEEEEEQEESKQGPVSVEGLNGPF